MSEIFVHVIIITFYVVFFVLLMWRKWASIVILHLQIFQSRVSQTFILKNIVAFSLLLLHVNVQSEFKTVHALQPIQNNTNCCGAVNDMSFKWTMV